MKSHAFVRENAPRAILYGQIYSHEVKIDEIKRDEEKTNIVVPHTPCPSFSKFLYFLFVPTLIYRDSYPRTSSVRWKYVISQLIQFATTSLFAYYLFYRFCLPVFRHFNSEHVTLKIFVLSILNCTLPGALLLFCSNITMIFFFLICFRFSVLRFSSLLVKRVRRNASFCRSTILQRKKNVVDKTFVFLHRISFRIGGRQRRGAVIIAPGISFVSFFFFFVYRLFIDDLFSFRLFMIGFTHMSIVIAIRYVNELDQKDDL